MPLLTLLSAVAVIVLLNLIFYRTAIGRAFRATADDPESPSSWGLDPARRRHRGRRFATKMTRDAVLDLFLVRSDNPTAPEPPCFLRGASDALRQKRLVSSFGTAVFGAVEWFDCGGSAGF